MNSEIANKEAQKKRVANEQAKRNKRMQQGGEGSRKGENYGQKGGEIGTKFSGGSHFDREKKS